MKTRLVIVTLLALLICALPARAANDPGHDSLYLEQDRDNNLTGRLNISKTLEVANRMFSTYLDILGDGTQPSGSQNRLWSSATNLYLESAYDIIINGVIGTTRMVRLGDSAGDAVRLNVTGDTFIEGYLNVSGDINTSGEIYTQGTKVQKRVSGTCNAGEAIQSINEDGTVNCQSTSGANSGGGWTNTSTTTSTGLLVHINNGANITGNLNLSGLIELGNDVRLLRGASNQLELASGDSLNLASGDLLFGGTTRISSAGVGTLAAGSTVDGSAICTVANGLCSGANSGGGWTNTSTTTHTSLDVKVDTKTLVVNATDNDVGIGTANPNATLHVKGEARFGTPDQYVRIDDDYSAGTARIEADGGVDLDIRASGGNVIITLG